MTIGWWLWLVPLWLVALVWASRHLDVSRAKREFPPLDEDSYDAPPEPAPKVSILIAAKDEAANIETAVRTMLEQDYPNFELIVINDRSTDGTRDILDRLAAESSANGNGRLRVVHIEQLRDGWFGKNNAMREGMTHATGDWLCFSDADCKQTSTRTLSLAMRHALEHGVDFLSVLPFLDARSLWERIIQPVCGAVMVFWFHPRRVNNPDHPAAYANGAYMLMTRETYDTIGGHELVKAEVNEDMHMARLTKERQRRLKVVQNDGLYSVRMYTGLGEIWRGWSRIFYGCFGTSRRLRISMLFLLCTNVFPYASAILAWVMVALRGWSDAGPWAAVAVSATLAVGLQMSVIARFYRLSRVSPWLAPTFIVGAVICIGMLASAMRRLGGRGTTTWRGTTYRADKVIST
ncbi:MAG: glycosyltransferase [Phycisphaerae bacterium]|nr:glycosyltransferase [Phycisphaerae bacterium]